MRLTKTRLKQIIKEELHKVLHEQHGIPVERQQKKKEKATFENALINFVKSLSGMTHEAMSGEWLQKLLKISKRSIRKGDYAQALKDVTKAAVYQKLPKVEILTTALEALKGVEVPKESWKAMAAFGSSGAGKL